METEQQENFEERYLLEQIRAIQESYQKSIQPLVDRLVYIRSTRIRPYVMIQSEDGTHHLVD